MSLLDEYLYPRRTLTDEEYVEASNHFGLNRMPAPALASRIDSSLEDARRRARNVVWFASAAGAVFLAVVVTVIALLTGGR